MDAYVLEHIRIGTNPSGDPEGAERSLRAIPPAFYRNLMLKKDTAFNFLATLPLPEAMGFIRALALAEQMGLSPGGSVSLLIPAFSACKNRAAGEVAEIADWIVCNNDNPYTPFNFQSTRAYWRFARQGSASPSQTWERVQELKAKEARAKESNSINNAVTMGIQGLRMGISPASPALRDLMEQRLEKETLE